MMDVSDETGVLEAERSVLNAMARLKADYSFKIIMEWLHNNINTSMLRITKSLPDNNDNMFNTRHHFFRGYVSALIDLYDMVMNAEEYQQKVDSIIRQEQT